MQVHRLLLLTVVLGLVCTADGFADEPLAAEVPDISNSIRLHPGVQSLSLTVDTTKFVVIEGKQVPRTLVNNPDLVSVLPLSPNQIQLVARKPGVTQLTFWDDMGEAYTVDVVVHGDAKELRLLLKDEFPNASLRVRPLSNSLVLSGWVDDPEVITRAVRFAEEYYPKVINNVRVGSNQQVQLHVQVMEVSRTKLRQLGIDWATFGSDGFAVQSVSGLIQQVTSNAASVVGTGGSTLNLGLANGDFFAAVDALRQNDFVKVLAEPTLTTLSGRPAAFNSGGEFPILVPQGLGTVAIEYKQFGTRVDFVPIVLGNGNIRLEVRPQVSEVDSSRGIDIDGVRVPGLRNRWVDTAVEMRAGQTLALAGLIQERVESQNRGLPYLADLPMVGALFRRVRHTVNEIELLVMVRPEFADAMDPEAVPMFGPGESSGSPNNHELYLNGFLEVPQRCCEHGDCQHCRPGRGQFSAPPPMPVGTATGHAFDPGAAVNSDPSQTHFVRLRDEYGPGARTSAAKEGHVRSVVTQPTNASPSDWLESADQIFPVPAPAPAAVPLPETGSEF